MHHSFVRKCYGVEFKVVLVRFNTVERQSIGN